MGSKWILRETGWEGVKWVYMAQDRGRWWVLVNAVMNLRVMVLRCQLVNRKR
jgi:hypothetical protein